MAGIFNYLKKGKVAFQGKPNVGILSGPVTMGISAIINHHG